jgi:hypothetical protein
MRDILDGVDAVRRWVEKYEMEILGSGGMSVLKEEGAEALRSLAPLPACAHWLHIKSVYVFWRAIFEVQIWLEL